MKYYSTNNKYDSVSFRQALLQGLADDRGLFMPESIPQFTQTFIDNLSELSFQEIAFSIGNTFIDNEISNAKLNDIITSSISFPAPIVKLTNKLSILELFHGPTLAFKDFGARFMARTMEHFIQSENSEITILVATSGDTGSAVANGFLNVDGINVIVLFPNGKISEIQKKQITTLNNNITAVAIEGTFDDCQRLVKKAFIDEEIKSPIKLSSANSINIGRLIPQSFYYFESYKNMDKKTKIVYSIPSGNLGNITAGLIAKKMGLPIHNFIAATNSNDVFTNFINTGYFKPRSSQITLSNAMDVGNPSNHARIIDMFNNNHSLISDLIYSSSFSDKQTLNKIHQLNKDYGYIIDPHGAIGCLALDQFIKEENNNISGVVLETAHPAKFIDVFKNNLNFMPEIPNRLAVCLKKNSKFDVLSNDYNEFKSFLLN